MLLVIAVIAWPALPPADLRVRDWAGTLLLGAAVFAIWIIPDHLFPGYRHFWLFENPFTGRLETSLSTDARSQAPVLLLRMFRAVAIVPVVEEMFWRGWLMRWLIRSDFSRSLGNMVGASFLDALRVLFARSMGRTGTSGWPPECFTIGGCSAPRSLGDLISAHAVTNACLSAYVIAAGKWEYWL